MFLQHQVFAIHIYPREKVLLFSKIVTFSLFFSFKLAWKVLSVWIWEYTKMMWSIVF